MFIHFDVSLIFSIFCWFVFSLECMASGLECSVWCMMHDVPVLCTWFGVWKGLLDAVWILVLLSYMVCESVGSEGGEAFTYMSLYMMWHGMQ